MHFDLKCESSTCGFTVIWFTTQSDVGDIHLGGNHTATIASIDMW